MKVKSFFKYVLLVIICVACMFICNSFLSPSVVSITKGETNGVYQTYIVKYSNGKTSAFTVKNGEDGKDGQNITIEDLYQATKTANNYGDDYTILDFINDYLKLTTEEQDQTRAYLGVLSAVEVYSEFPTGYSISSMSTTYSLGMGAGVIYQPEGVTDDYYIITNYHVTYNRTSLSDKHIATKITCYFYGAKGGVSAKQESNGGYTLTYSGDYLECEYVGGSMSYDIAVLKVKNPSLILASNAKSVKISSKEPTVGENVFAIGNPEGLGTSVTKGIISVDSEYVSMLAPDNATTITFRAMRIDASVNGGNSGGGLFNANGELLGIVNSKIDKDGIEGMAYALPISVSSRIADVLIENQENSKTATKVDLGLSTAIDTSIAVYDEETKGVKIVQTIKVSAKTDSTFCADLSVGDIITGVTISGKKYSITREYMLDELTFLMKKDTVVVFHVNHLNSNIDVPVTVSESNFVEVV